MIRGPGAIVEADPLKIKRLGEFSQAQALA
jgi:hypothetical protein